MRILLAALFLISSLHATGQPPKTLTALQDSIKKIMERKHIPGLMMALIHRDSVIWEGGLGVANLDAQSPVTAHHRFRVGSITKTFTSLAIQQLVRAGKFGLDSKLSDVAPEIKFTNAWESTEPIRVIHLLEHTAGFDDMHLNALVNNSGRTQSRLEEVATQQKSLTTRWKPGTRFSYSNPGYTILGFIIEKYSGQSYETYVTENILKPLRMNETVFVYENKEPYASGYSWDGEYFAAGAPMINGNAAGAISSTAHDMARFVRMMLNDGALDSAQIIMREDLRRMEQSQSTAAGRMGLALYGEALALKNYGDPKLRKPFYGHDGGIMGFISDFSYNTELGLGFVLSNNGENQMNDIGGVIAEFLYQGKTLGTPPAAPLDAAALNKYLGNYRAASPRNQIGAWLEYLLSSRSVSIRQDTLRVQTFLGDETSAVPLSAGLFRKSTDNNAGVALLDVDGPVLFIDRTYYEQVSGLALWLPRVLVLLPLLLTAILIPVYLVWIVNTVRKKIAPRNLLVRSLPLLAWLSFVGMLLTFGILTDLKNIAAAASVNGFTLTIFVLSIAIPVFAALGLWAGVRRWTDLRGGFVRFCTIGLSAGMLVVSAFLATNGWIGLALWLY